MIHARSGRGWNRPLVGRARPEAGQKKRCAKVRVMARGFESKSVESQQEEAQRSKITRPALSPEDQARQTRKAGLELALAQTQSELTAACQTCPPGNAQAQA